MISQTEKYLMRKYLTLKEVLNFVDNAKVGSSYIAGESVIRIEKITTKWWKRGRPKVYHLSLENVDVNKTLYQKVSALQLIHRLYSTKVEVKL